MDIETGKVTLIEGKDGGGIGAIAYCTQSKVLAVAEKCQGRSPNVYIYNEDQL